ncbi:MAG TPA: nuclear transport factor 2 family protein [Terriglobia bacterium]|nr:nuclear transport factor 2 family protein [Terriglobia bacterium]
MSAESGRLDFARRYTAAWCSHDPAQVAAFFSPQGSLTVNGGAPAAGRAAIAELARGFMTDFPDLHLVMDRLEDRRERTEYHWTLAGTYRATGKRVRISGYEEWMFGADGLVADSQGHFDAAEYQRQCQFGFE